MEIKTKYDIGQRVFFMSDNRVCWGTIESFDIGFGYNNGTEYLDICYCVENKFTSDFAINEKKLFLTKEELLKSL